MTAGRLALLLGLFGVPAALLWAGHRLRRRSPRWHGAFWGALLAHLIAAVVATVASMVPPEEWRPEDVWRGIFGFWTLLVAPVVGAAAGALLGASSGREQPPTARRART
jgi:hypothetical protein